MIVYIAKLFERYSTTNRNEVGLGNEFNNLMLHSITLGEPRTSYVIRMAKSNTVFTSYDTVKRSLERSNNCKSFAKILDVFTEKTDKILVRDLRWEDV